MIKTKDSFRVSKTTARRNGISVMTCPYRANASVECFGEVRCVVCGWHPKVEEERIAKLREKFKTCP